MSNLRNDLDSLRQALPDPFRLSQELDAFLRQERAQALTRNGQASAEALLGFAKQTLESDLLRVAVLLLSQLDPTFYYQELLGLLKQAPRNGVEAMELGFWRIRLPPAQLAQDLVGIASPESPAPLLLLQRPEARLVKPQLLALAERDTEPLSVYALYALSDTLEEPDHELLARLARSNHPTTAALAREHIDRMKPRP